MRVVKSHIMHIITILYIAYYKVNFGVMHIITILYIAYYKVHFGVNVGHGF
jgi:hypothetical protein